MPLKLNTAFPVLLISLLFALGCGELKEEKVAVSKPTVSISGIPQITIPDKPSSGIGSSEGANLWSYKGYRASLILENISDDIVSVSEKKDKVIDFYYHFPDLNKEKASIVAVQAISDALGCRMDTSHILLPFFRLNCARSSVEKDGPETFDGVKVSVQNGQAVVNQGTLEEIQDLLNKHRKERFLINTTDTCLVSVRIDLTTSFSILQESLFSQSGVRIEKEMRSVRNIKFE